MRAMNWGWSRLTLGVAVLAMALVGLGCKDVVEAPTSLVYAASSVTYIAGTAITPNTPTAAGGVIDSYAVSPSLPAGLSLDTKTGIISGTPTTVTAAASYTVTATNATGSTTASLSITVAGPSLTITTQPASQSILVGATATFTVVASGTGTLTYQWLKAGAAIAGETAASYTTPAAILADSGSSFSVQISDGYGDSVTSSAALLTVTSSAAGPGTSITTGSLAAARAFHTATLLNTGNVLITGGKDASSSLSSAELYNPTAGTFSATVSLSVARYNHSATTLADGRVLIIGGVSFAATLASAEIYDPATGLFAATGSLLAARSDHTATLLASGKVLLAGGYRGSALATAELYDPLATVTSFTATGSLNTARAYQTASTLANGKVLVVGGAATATAELYDPTAGTFTNTGSLLIARATWHAAALLPSGKVLIAGGLGTGTPGTLLSEAELFDPATGLFTATGNLTTGREAPTATVLPNGKTLLVGGAGAGYLSSAELYY